MRKGSIFYMQVIKGGVSLSHGGEPLASLVVHLYVTETPPWWLACKKNKIICVDDKSDIIYRNLAENITMKKYIDHQANGKVNDTGTTQHTHQKNDMPKESTQTKTVCQSDPDRKDTYLSSYEVHQHHPLTSSLRMKEDQEHCRVSPLIRASKHLDAFSLRRWCLMRMDRNWLDPLEGLGWTPHLDGVY